MKKYYVYYPASRITCVEIKRETNKNVVIAGISSGKEKSRKKNTSDYGYFDTWEEARHALIVYFEQFIEQKNLRLTTIQSDIADAMDCLEAAKYLTSPM